MPLQRGERCTVVNTGTLGPVDGDGVTPVELARIAPSFGGLFAVAVLATGCDGGVEAQDRAPTAQTGDAAAIATDDAQATQTAQAKILTPAGSPIPSQEPTTIALPDGTQMVVSPTAPAPTVTTEAQTPTQEVTVTTEATLLPTSEPSPTATRTVESLRSTQKAVETYVGVLEKAGIVTTSEAILQELQTYEAIGKDGMKYEIASTQDGYPLMIKVEGGNWEEITGQNTKNVTGINLGAFVGGYGSREYYSRLKEAQRQFFGSPSVYNSWKDVDAWGSAGVDDDYKTATSYNTGNILMHPLIWETDLPDNVNSLTGEALRKALLEHASETVSAYPKVTMFTVNELTPAFLKNLGTVEEQALFMHDLNAIIKTGNPNRKLILSDTLNHGSDSYNGSSNTRFTEALDRFGSDIDVIGIQLIVDAGYVPPEGWDQMIYERIKHYYETYHKPVIITELNVNIKALVGGNRLKQQADIYEMLARGIRRANEELDDVCQEINVLTIGDQFSPFERNEEQFGYSTDADPTLFDDEVERKIAWFGLMKGLLSK
ncbi:MAG: endo-1,4-beta-xylanase [Patescibacteria group bacterium]